MTIKNNTTLLLTFLCISAGLRGMEGEKADWLKVLETETPVRPTVDLAITTQETMKLTLLAEAAHMREKIKLTEDKRDPDYDPNQPFDVGYGLNLQVDPNKEEIKKEAAEDDIDIKNPTKKRKTPESSIPEFSDEKYCDNSTDDNDENYEE